MHNADKVVTEMDAYTLDEIGGDKAIVALPNILGFDGSQYEGSMVIGRDYLLELCSAALKRGLISGDDMLSLSY